MLDIKITRTTSPKEKPQDETKLGFGKKFTDHMFVMDYTEGEGWHDARIVPYAPFPLDPATVVFHYAQEIFEGMKAYRTADDTIQLFRPDCNAKRMQDSADRLCIPKIPVEDYIQAVEALVDVDRDWVPHTEGASLYIRPFVFANDVGLGVHASKHYIFCIICAPSGAYYAEGINPVRIYVEDEYIRAAPGLTGFTKCGGNYAASIKAGELAEEQGYAQVLWLDGVEKKYVEEVGSMNIMFKIDGKVYTAATVGTVLPGVTRRSCIELLKDWGYEVIEGKLAIADIFNHHTNVDINNRIVCFDIKQLGKQLKKLGMLIVQDAVWGRVTANRSAGKSTRYYADEFHLLLKEEQTAAYSVEIWKRFRKWGGIPTALTQNVKDLLASPEVSNIFENSDFVYMLNQANGDRQILAKQLNISPHQLSYVTHSGEGEGLLFFGNVILPFVDHFPKDLELYRILTTRLSEVAEAQKHE